MKINKLLMSMFTLGTLSTLVPTISSCKTDNNPNGISVSHSGSFTKGDTLKASDVTVYKTRDGKSQGSALKWGTEYTITQQGKATPIDNFDTTGFKLESATTYKFDIETVDKKFKNTLSVSVDTKKVTIKFITDGHGTVSTSSKPVDEGTKWSSSLLNGIEAIPDYGYFDHTWTDSSGNPLVDGTTITNGFTVKANFVVIPSDKKHEIPSQQSDWKTGEYFGAKEFYIGNPAVSPSIYPTGAMKFEKFHEYTFVLDNPTLQTGELLKYFWMIQYTGSSEVKKLLDLGHNNNKICELKYKGVAQTIPETIPYGWGEYAGYYLTYNEQGYTTGKLELTIKVYEEFNAIPCYEITTPTKNA